jgi:hypothetical protein
VAKFEVEDVGLCVSGAAKRRREPVSQNKTARTKSHTAPEVD